jgi:hypothetical protein
MRSPLRVRACAAILGRVFAVAIKRRPRIRLPIRQRTRVLEQWRRLNRAANKRVAPTAGSRALHSPVLLGRSRAPGRGKLYRFFRTGLCAGLIGRSAGAE